MMKGIQLTDPLSQTTHYIRMVFSQTDFTLATATGFIYEFEETYYLITNGHNVTGFNPYTKASISNHAGIPDLITTNLRYNVEYGLTFSKYSIKLYKDFECQFPNWYIHPMFGYRIDVIAIPLFQKQSLPTNIELFPINQIKFDNFSPIVSDDVFVLGYPFNITDSLELPIWKRGSIATEPDINYKDFPIILIDTATRSGMSGSPVIFRRSGIHGLENGLPTNRTVLGTITGFLGIYSGRIGVEDEIQAQLGIVWKKDVIEEILVGKCCGTIDFQKGKFEL